MRVITFAGALAFLAWAWASVASAEVALTQEERAWRDRNATVSIAVDNDFAPINFVENGRPVGIAVDFLRLIEQRSGLQFEFVTGSWADLIDRAMRHEVDAIINADKTAERQERLLYTRPYYRVPQAFVVRQNSPAVAAPEDLTDQSVVVLKGTSRVDYLRRRFPGVRIVEVETILDQFALVLAGEADVMMSALPVMHHGMLENLVSGLRISGVFQTDAVDRLHVAVRDSAPQLRSILDKAIADISREERLEILSRWLPQQLIEHQDSRTATVDLTAAERRWIEAHPVIRVAGDRSWPPIEFLGREGEFEGLAVDYLERIEEAVGLRFEFDLESDWATVVAKLKARELDMFSAAAQTPERREYADFTAPYLTLQAMIFTHDDEPFVNGLTGLSGRRVAAVKGYAVTEFLRSVSQDFDLVEAADVASGLRALVAGEVDVYIGSLLVTGYHLRQEGIANVMAAGEIPFRIGVSMAARNDWPELRSILNKAISTIGRQEREAINRRWMGLQISRPPDYALMWRWAMFGVAMLLLFLVWNWYLQRKTAAQKVTLKRQNAALEAEVDIRRRAEEEARGANAMKSRLLANISHELRTPLNAIIGFSDLLHESRGKTLPDERKAEYAGYINSAGRHLLNLVNDALDLSAVEAGKMTLEEGHVDLDVLVEEIIPMVETRARDAGVTLSHLPAPATPAVRADARRLRQVVLNLIDNAIKFTPRGGRIDVATGQRDDGWIWITVADTGPGMGPEQMKTAFKAFERGTDPFVRRSEGVGLGLALSEEIARAHGGRLELESAPGEGTTVHVLLPGDRAEAPLALRA